MRARRRGLQGNSAQPSRVRSGSPAHDEGGAEAATAGTRPPGGRAGFLCIGYPAPRHGVYAGAEAHRAPLAVTSPGWDGAGRCRAGALGGAVFGAVAAGTVAVPAAVGFGGLAV